MYVIILAIYGWVSLCMPHKLRESKQKNTLSLCHRGHAISLRGLRSWAQMENTGTKQRFHQEIHGKHREIIGNAGKITVMASYGHLLVITVITGYYNGIIHSINIYKRGFVSFVSTYN